jgi:hypothetical protein
MTKEKEKMSSASLRLLYADIIKGYSKTEDKRYKTTYIKHLGTIDAAGMDEIKSRYYEEAKKEGLPTEDDKLEYLHKEGDWTKQDEAKLDGLRSWVKQLKVNKSKLFLERDKNQLINQIRETEGEIQVKENRRLEWIGMTCDSYSSKKSNEHYIFQSLFKNSECLDHLLSVEEFDELSTQEIFYLVKLYNGKMEPFFPRNLKKIALSGFFLNFFYLCDDNPMTFFGEPAVSLTFYQAELFGHAKYFKSILQDSKNKPPHDVMDDPDAIIDWYESSKASQAAFDKVKDTGNVGGSSIVGASKQEMTKLGAIDDGEKFIDLAQEAMKKGGSLNMEELIKLHGQ